MADLFGRLAARTLATETGLRPAGLGRFEPRAAEGPVEGVPDPDGLEIVAAGAAPARPRPLRPAGETLAAGERTVPPSVARAGQPAPPQRARSDPPPPAGEGTAPRTDHTDSPAVQRAAHRRAAPSTERPRPATAQRPVRPVVEPERPRRRSPREPTPGGAEAGGLGDRSESEDAPRLAAVDRRPERAPAGERAAAPAGDADDRSRRGRAATGEPTVRVAIGRLEIRGSQPPAPPSRPRPWSEGPLLTLDEYLRRRGDRE